jgi:hypothetical protein
MRRALLLLVIVAGCSETDEHKRVRVWREQLSAPVARGSEYPLLYLCLHAPPGATPTDLDRCRRDIAPAVVTLSQARYASEPAEACRIVADALPLVEGARAWHAEHCTRPHSR